MYYYIVGFFIVFVAFPEFLGLEISDNENKMNVVLFFAKTCTSEIYSEDEGIRYLKFIEKKRVKHARQAEDISQYRSTGSDCKELLKGSIYSLITYCRNVLGMTTAIASQENNTFTNSLRFKKSALEDLEIQYHHPRNLNHLREKARFITKPEHTEVFKIRSKRQNHIGESSDESEPPPGFNLLGVLTGNLKLTLFGKLLEKAKDENPVLQFQSQSDQASGQSGQALGQSGQALGQSGRVTQSCLFELVKDSLDNMQDCSKGFLLIVLGGSLKEISNPYTDFIQSVKHVIESTDEKNTLIVVTGSCPDVEQTTTEGGSCSIPVYVKGPSSFLDDISFTDQLYDVPYAIKNVLCDLKGAANKIV